MAPWISILPQYTLLSILRGLQIHFCVIIRETSHHELAYVRLCPLVGRGLSLAVRRTNMTAELRWFRWSVLVMTALEQHNICCRRTWSSIWWWGWPWLFLASSIKFLTRRNLKYWWVCWALCECNRIQLFDPKFGKTVSWSTWGYVDPLNSCWPYVLKCWQNPCAG